MDSVSQYFKVLSFQLVSWPIAHDIFCASGGICSALKTWGISSDMHSPPAYETAAAAFRFRPYFQPIRHWLSGPPFARPTKS